MSGLVGGELLGAGSVRLAGGDDGTGGGGSGTISRITSVDGSIVVTNPTGPTADLAGAVPFGWDAGVAQQIAAVLGPGVDWDYRCIELDDPDQYDITERDGPYVQGAPGAYSGGVLVGSTLGGANAAYFYPKGMNNFVLGTPVVVPFQNLKTRSWAVAILVKFPVAPVAGAHFIDILNVNGTTDHSELAIRMNGLISTTVLQVVQDNTPAGGGTTTTACNAAGTIGSGIILNTMLTAVFVWNAATQTGTLKINGATAANCPATNQPVQPGVPSCNTNSVGSMAFDAFLWAWQRSP